MTIHPSSTSDRQRSQELELKAYLNALPLMYKNAFDENGLIYDIASKLTDGFVNISPDAILSDSRIIKILRYAIAPSISQMKLGQFLGLKTVDRFEKSKLTSGNIFQILEQIAVNIANFATTKIDKDRFIWIEDAALRSDLSLQFARKWTCSIAADQNAGTAYRNWRKEKQESAAKEAIEKLGYSPAEAGTMIESVNDLEPGTYTVERRVKGRTIQKADLVCRSKRNLKLVLIEAKAVGVEIDATKRVKECCDKASDWSSSTDLSSPIVVSLIAGFFAQNNIDNLEASNIFVIWEHDMSKFSKIL